LISPEFYIIIKQFLSDLKISEEVSVLFKLFLVFSLTSEGIYVNDQILVNLILALFDAQ
jgi:hypothetical protein